MIAAGSLLPVAEGVANEFRFEPWVRVEESFDDNIHYEASDTESDFITRVTPGVLLGYESGRLDLSGSLSFDAEAYLRNPELNSALVRAYADLGADYRLTRRLTLGGRVDYMKTDTPLDFLDAPVGGVPGARDGRYEARRFSATGSGRYRISRSLEGALSAGVTDEEVPGETQSQLHILEASLQQKLLRKGTLSYGYLGRRYRLQGDLDTPAPPERQTYHVPWVGYSHSLSERMTVAARGGPIFGEDSVEPYLATSISFRNPRGTVSANYERDRTTLLGDAEIVDVSSWSLTWDRDFESGISIDVAPGYVTVSPPGGGRDAYTTLRVGASYTLNPAVQLTAGYELNRQRSSRETGPAAEVRRNVLEVGLTFTLPRSRTRPAPR